MEMTLSEVEQLKYSVLQVALETFDKLPSALDQTQISKTEQIAKNKYFIQKKVLETIEARHVVITQEHIDASLKQIIARFPDEDAFSSQLEDSNLNLDSFREAISRELRVDAVMETVAYQVPAYSVTDAKLYYYLNQDKFSQPESRTMRHILVTINPEFPENCREQAFERASSLSQRLKKKPSRFAEQALKHSECPTAVEGGVIGQVTRGTLFPELDKLAFEMKQGQVSDAVESSVGFHVMYCEAVNQPQVMPLNEALPKIIEKMTDRNRKLHQRQWIKKIMATDSSSN